MQSPPHILIVGAGISGLATAFSLQEKLRNAEITILEITQRIGGLITTEQKEGYLIEAGPDAVSSDHHHTLKLCTQLGLIDKLVEPAPGLHRKIILHEGRLVPYPMSPKDILRSGLFGLSSVLRLGLERFLPRNQDKKDESIWHFTCRRFGTKLADFFADAVGTECFAGDPKSLSIRSCFPELVQAEEQFGNLSCGLEKLRKASQNGSAGASPSHGPMKSGLPPQLNLFSHTFKEGMQTLPDSLAQQLKQPSCFGVGVHRVVANQRPAQSRWLVQCEGDRSWPADVVILTSPAPRQAAILAELDADLADALLTIPHAPLVVLTLGYSTQHVRKPIDWSTLIVPQRYKRDLLRVDFCSCLYPHRAPEGHLLLRIICGGWHRREMIHWDDSALLMLVRQELRKLFGITKPPVFVNLARYPTAIPQMTVGHSERLTNINRMAARHPGLFLTGQAFRGPNINDCLVNATHLVKQIIAFLSSQRHL